MKAFAEAFQTKHSKISVVEDIDTLLDEDDDGIEIEREYVSYNISAIPGLENLTLNLAEEEDFAHLDKLIQSGPTLFSDFLGGRFGQQVEVVLTKISRGIFSPPPPSRSLTVQVAYQGVEISCTLTSSRTEKTSVGFIAAKMVGVRLQPRRTIAVISGLSISDPAHLEAATNEILRSVLFDIEFTYGFAFETTNLENLKEAQRATKRRGPPLPREPIRLMFKGYVPELIEYFHVAEKVDYLPFKFICYFHVLEYFMDKSAYSVVSRKVKQLLLSPDFHLKSSEYIANAVNIIKLETERNTTDKIKIGRVIGEFAQSDTIQSHLTSISMLTHFTREHTLACAKPLKLSAIAFDSEKSYLESVAKRIYAVRCSIVHSNPDFDESKAVPFLPTPKNIEFLRTEIELIREISRTIICNTAA